MNQKKVILFWNLLKTSLSCKQQPPQKPKPTSKSYITPTFQFPVSIKVKPRKHLTVLFYWTCTSLNLEIGLFNAYTKWYTTPEPMPTTQTSISVTKVLLPWHACGQTLRVIVIAGPCTLIKRAPRSTGWFTQSPSWGWAASSCWPTTCNNVWRGRQRFHMVRWFWFLATFSNETRHNHLQQVKAYISNSEHLWQHCTTRGKNH